MIILISINILLAIFFIFTIFYIHRKNNDSNFELFVQNKKSYWDRFFDNKYEKLINYSLDIQTKESIIHSILTKILQVEDVLKEKEKKIDQYMSLIYKVDEYLQRNEDKLVTLKNNLSTLGDNNDFIISVLTKINQWNQQMNHIEEQIDNILKGSETHISIYVDQKQEMIQNQIDNFNHNLEKRVAWLDELEIHQKVLSDKFHQALLDKEKENKIYLDEQYQKFQSSIQSTLEKYHQESQNFYFQLMKKQEIEENRWQDSFEQQKNQINVLINQETKNIIDLMAQQWESIQNNHQNILEEYQNKENQIQIEWENINENWQNMRGHMTEQLEEYHQALHSTSNTFYEQSQSNSEHLFYLFQKKIDKLLEEHHDDLHVFKNFMAEFDQLEPSIQSKIDLLQVNWDESQKKFHHLWQQEWETLSHIKTQELHKVFEEYFIQQQSELKNSYRDKFLDIRNQWDQDKQKFMSLHTDLEHLDKQYHSLEDQIQAQSASLDRHTQKLTHNLQDKYNFLNLEQEKSYFQKKEHIQEQFKNLDTFFKENQANYLDNIQKEMSDFVNTQKQLSTDLTQLRSQYDIILEQSQHIQKVDHLSEQTKQKLIHLDKLMLSASQKYTDIQGLSTKMEKLKRLVDNINLKTATFQVEKERLDRIEDQFRQVKIIQSSLENEFYTASKDYEFIQNLQLKIYELENKEKNLRSELKEWEQKTHNIDTLENTLRDSHSELHQLQKQIKSHQILIEKIQNNLIQIEKDSGHLLEKESDITLASQTLKELPKHLNEIDQKVKKIDKIRTRLAQVEGRLVNSLDEAEEKIKLLDNLNKTDRDSSPNDGKSFLSKELKFTVTKLYEKGWTKKSIAQATRLSITEVELILEMKE